MPGPSLIQTLSATDQLWDAPTAAVLDDPQWEAAWSAASSDTVRRNLARGWVWSFLSSHPDSSKPIASFLDILGKQPAWIQQVQPFLDITFFAPHLHRPAWQLLAECLLTELPTERSYIAWLRNYVFADKGAQRAALVTGFSSQDCVSLCRPLGRFLTQHAWQLTADTPALRAAACRLSVKCGHYHQFSVPTCAAGFAPPQFNLPTEANIWYTLGIYIANGRSTYIEDMPSLSDVRKTVRGMDPVLVAGVLYSTVSDCCIRDENGNHILRTDAVFGEHPHDTDPYTVIARWIPSRKAAFDAAKTLGVSCLETLALIASEQQTAPVVLPETITEATP